MISESFDNIWDALEDDPIKRADLKALSSKLVHFRQVVDEKGWDIATTAERLQISNSLARVLLERGIEDIKAEWIPAIPDSEF